MRSCSCWTCPSTHQRDVRRRACALPAKQQHSARSHKLGAHRDLGCGDVLLRPVAEAPAANSGIAGRLRSSAAPALEAYTPDDRRWQHQQASADLPVRNSAGSASAEAEVSKAASAPDLQAAHPMVAQAAPAATSMQAWTYELDSAPGLGAGSTQRLPSEEQRSGGEGAAWVATSGAECAPRERAAEQSRGRGRAGAAHANGGFGWLAVSHSMCG